MKQKHRHSESTIHSSLPADAPTADPQTADARNVLVTHGIHRGRFPVGGMLVREARQILQNLINIDPGAVPVINGTPVTEDQTISGNVTMLSFVKPSSIKG